MNISSTPPTPTTTDFKGFKVYPIAGVANPAQPHGRRDFYKIVLISGEMTLNYGGQKIDLSGSNLILLNPRVPHAVEHRTERKGFACVFTETFLAGRERTELLQHSPLFRFDGSPVLSLSPEQTEFMSGLFQKMRSVYTSDYDYKEDLLKTCLELILQEALRIQPPLPTLSTKNGATRLTQLFLDLLERQFPIESPVSPLRFRTPQDFAEALSVHVNYLNRSVKESTGKPTSVHLAERITAEAKALLQHTDWSVADIAYSLGFEYPTYFHNYFKRITGFTPNLLRTRKV